MRKTGRGFTLIEMAIVLVIVGLILATTMPLLTERIARDKAAKGSRNVNTLKQEIIGYAMIEGHLPTADYVTDNFSGAEDAWGNPVAYYAATSLPAAAGSGNTISGATSTDLKLIRTVSGPTSTTYQNMAFILASIGPNNNAEAAWNDSSVSHSGDGDAGYTGEFEYFDRGGYGLQAGFYYDDIVEYVTLEYLQTKVDDSQSASGPSNSIGSFDDGIDNMLTSTTSGPNSSTQTANNPIIINSETNELELGGVDAATGCTWYSGLQATNASFPCTATSGVVTCTPVDAGGDHWKSLHFVMRINFQEKDYFNRVYDERYAGGWVFAIISGIASANIQSTAPCGTGSGEGFGYLGYASHPVTSNDFIDDPKFGVEVDVYKDPPHNDHSPAVQTRNDPDPAVSITEAGYDMTWNQLDELNHVANVYWEYDASNTPQATAHGQDNQHGFSSSWGSQSNGNPSYSASTNSTGMISGVGADSGLMWLEDGEDHWLRVELVRTAPGVTPAVYTTYVWMDDTPNATFLNVGASMVGTAAANYEWESISSFTIPLTATWSGGNDIHDMMDTFRFGWTTATGDASGRGYQSINTGNIGQFGWNFTTF